MRPRTVGTKRIERAPWSSSPEAHADTQKRLKDGKAGKQGASNFQTSSNCKDPVLRTRALRRCVTGHPATADWPAWCSTRQNPSHLSELIQPTQTNHALLKRFSSVYKVPPAHITGSPLQRHNTVRPRYELPCTLACNAQASDLAGGSAKKLPCPRAQRRLRGERSSHSRARAATARTIVRGRGAWRGQAARTERRDRRRTNSPSWRYPRRRTTRWSGCVQVSCLWRLRSACKE